MYMTFETSICNPKSPRQSAEFAADRGDQLDMSKRFADDFDAFGGRTVVITGGASGIGLATARMVAGAASY